MKRTISAVGVNSLEQPQNNPNVDGHDVEVTSESTVQNGAGEGTSSENEDLSRMGIFGSKAKGCGVLVVEFVDMLIEDTSMERLVS